MELQGTDYFRRTAVLLVVPESRGLVCAKNMQPGYEIIFHGI